MKVMSIDDIREKKITLVKGDKVAFVDRHGRTRIGTVRLREVMCGKERCTKCPHGTYAYAQYREGSKVLMKYIGNVK